MLSIYIVRFDVMKIFEIFLIFRGTKQDPRPVAN